MKRTSISLASAVALAAALWVALASGCKPGAPGDHGHDHAAAPAEEEGPPPIAITRWTDRYELFVELTPPKVGAPVAYHAHVTDLADFHAVTEGTFRVFFRQGDKVVAEHSVDKPKRPGIFVFEDASPAEGTYQVEMTYETKGVVDRFDCGEIPVVKEIPTAEEEADTSITFLKESQWKIAFTTAWSEERSIAGELELAATVEPAGGAGLTLTAPTSGRFFVKKGLALAEGVRVEKGDVIGSIVPSTAGDDFNRLVFAAEEARIHVQQNEREIARIEPLVRDGLLAERRLIELKNQGELLASERRLAEARLGAITATTTTGLEIKASVSGVVVAAPVANGETVEAGAAVLQLSGGDHVWLRMRFPARDPRVFDAAAPARVRLASGEEIDLEARGATLLSRLPRTDPDTQLSTWIVGVPPPSDERDAGALSTGASAVVRLRVGKPTPSVVVLRGAVVEINTRPFVFVQIDGEHFLKRAVVLGPSAGDVVAIASGVDAHERVVTRGGFDIHLAAIMGTVESHRH